MRSTVAPISNQMKACRGREYEVLGIIGLGKVKDKVVPVLN
jgi:hypothetical protein